MGGGGVSSEPSTVVVSPSSIYQTTVTSKQPEFTCLWPKNASRATLSVSGAKSFADQTFTRGEGETLLLINSLTIEPPASFEEEGLVTFTLTFDSGETLSAKLASIRGIADVGTRVITDDLSSRAWRVVTRNALIPIIDEGVETVSLNGIDVSTELNGACGWYEWLKIPGGENHFAADSREATFYSIRDGFLLIIR